MKSIIIGLTPQGLSLLRIMSRAGIEVFALCHSSHEVGYKSRYGIKKIYHNSDELKLIIRTYVSTLTYKPYCYITSGEQLALILREYPELYHDCNVIASSYETVEKLAHKDVMYYMAQEKGFTFAKFSTLDKYIPGSLHFPVFLKRNFEIPLFFKTAKIETPERLNQYIGKIDSRYYKDVLIQEYIDIPSEYLLNISCQGYFHHGKPMGLLITNQIRRLNKGITSYIEEISDKKLIDIISVQCSDFMENMDYTGFAEFEFMYNLNTQKLFFIEINTRTCGLQSALKVKFKNINQIFLNPSNPPILKSREKKVQWMNILRDIQVRIQQKNLHHLFDIFYSSYDILDLKDIKPFFYQILK